VQADGLARSPRIALYHGTQKKEDPVAKTYTCRDVGVPCDWRVRGETEEEVMRKIREHAKTTHNMQQIPPDLEPKVRQAIRDER
jgi:predicted small metal-binding protein